MFGYKQRLLRNVPLSYEQKLLRNGFFTLAAVFGTASSLSALVAKNYSYTINTIQDLTNMPQSPFFDSAYLAGMMGLGALICVGLAVVSHKQLRFEQKLEQKLS